jgi:Family of unknown function (DUF6056)
MSARTRFFAVVVVLAITFAVICACEPVSADGWEHFAAARDPSRFHGWCALVRESYLAGNPRWGQLVLAATFHFEPIAIVTTPLVILATLLASMTLIRGRIPSPSDPDAATLLVQVLATALLTTPNFGTIWFHRPNCTNYLYPLLVQLVWLVPYRFLWARRPPPSAWLALAIIPLGLLAGAGNEHTGLGLALAGAACTWVAWRRDRRVPAWTLLGLAALVAGYIAVLTAPGQMVRYAGLGAKHSLFGRIVARGVLGNLEVWGLVIARLVPMLAVVAWVAGRSSWRGWLARTSRHAIAGWVAVAAVMVATTLGAPRVPARMLVAPAAMVALALGVFLVELATHRGKARRLHRASVAISATVLAVTLAIFVVTGVEGRARLRTLAHAASGSVACVPAYTFSAKTPFTVGDDLRNATLALRVAHAFGLAGIRRGCP